MRIGLGFGLDFLPGRLGGSGGGGASLLTAPTLSWTSGTTDNTPDLSVTFPDILVTGTDVTFEYATNAGFSGATSVVHDLTSPESLAQAMTLALSALADDTYYIRVKYEGSAWSNTETKTVDAAPTLTSPTGVKTGTTTATVGATTDQGDGALYWVVTTAVTAPSAAQVKAGQDHTGAAASASGSQAISSTGVKTANVTGLSAGTTYYSHLLHEDATAHQSNVVDSSSFTTDGSAYAGPGDVVSGATIWASPARCYNGAYAGGALMDLVDQAGVNQITINSLGTGFADLASIAAWVTAHTVTTIKVKQLYDQTGGGRHLTQATLSNMPVLTLLSVGGLPGLTFSGNQELVSPATITQAQPISMSAVAKITTNNGGSFIGSTVNVNLGPSNAANTVRIHGGTELDVTASDNAYHAYNGHLNGASSAVQADNGTAVTGNAGTTGLSSNNIRFGRNSGFATMLGTMMEGGVWGGISFTGTQRTNLNSNQHDATNGYNF